MRLQVADWQIVAQDLTEEGKRDPRFLDLQEAIHNAIEGKPPTRIKAIGIPKPLLRGVIRIVARREMVQYVPDQRLDPETGKRNWQINPVVIDIPIED